VTKFFLYDKFRMKLEDTEHFFFCFLQYFLGKLCNKGGLYNYVCVLASSKSHTFLCYDLWTYNMRGSNICTKVLIIIKIRREILMTVTARITVFLGVMSCILAEVQLKFQRNLLPQPSGLKI